MRHALLSLSIIVLLPSCQVPAGSYGGVTHDVRSNNTTAFVGWGTRPVPLPLPTHGFAK